MRSPEIFGTIKQTVKRGALPAALVATALMTSACDTHGIAENLVDCKNGPKSNSINFFLNPHQNTLVGSDYISAPIPGVLYDNNIAAIAVISDENTSMADVLNKTGIHTTFIVKGDNNMPVIEFIYDSKSFTVSGKPSLRDGVSGTDVSLQVSCKK